MAYGLERDPLKILLVNLLLVVVLCCNVFCVVIAVASYVWFLQEKTDEPQTQPEPSTTPADPAPAAVSSGDPELDKKIKNVKKVNKCYIYLIGMELFMFVIIVLLPEK